MIAAEDASRRQCEAARAPEMPRRGTDRPRSAGGNRTSRCGPGTLRLDAPTRSRHLRLMAKTQNSQKQAKKLPQRTPEQKKADKRAKKQGR